MKKRLFTPGPTPVPETVMLKMAEPIIHHLGYYDELNMITMISALEMTLVDCGVALELGAGLRAAQASFLTTA